MKNMIIMLMLFSCSILAAFVPIYDIQYTISPGGDGYYPSLLNGQVVETGGIVTGVDYSGDKYYISHPDGGAWNGLYVYENDHSPQIGDELLLTGEVTEYYGFTELSYITDYQVVSSGNQLPEAVEVSSIDASSEAYESVFVKISNVVVSQVYDQYSQWRADDGSGEANIGVGFYNLEESGFPLYEDYQIAEISGVVSYSWGEFYLNPRSINDLISSETGLIISFDSQNIYNETMLSLPINLAFLSADFTVQDFSFALHYDEELLTFESMNTAGMLLESSGISTQTSPGIFELTYDDEFTLENVESLVELNFTILNDGNAEMEFTAAAANSETIAYQSAGEITISLDSVAIGDTLTVIQKPILNIPEIVTPGEEFEIWCVAEEAIEDWEVELVFGDYNFEVEISQVDYEADLDRYILHAVAPYANFYELFDLHVTAENGIDDVSENAVELIALEKETFSFVHISDTHMPTHYFWGDNPELALSDSTEMEDLRQVIADINILNPEFVLLSGDLVNEGELEDFGNGRCYTKAQRVLSEFNVPVYLVAGNHDLGGWSDTPPEQGTARRDWWRFFGWEWLANATEDSQFHTQDYTFTYANNKFIGLEAYLNYDYYLYDIFGNESFIPNQMDWLDYELAASSEYDNRILFYHYDFSEQLNLEAMNIDMALYGHIHSNDGSIYNSPYNLAVDSVCDETQAYRIINVNQGVLQPLETQYATWPNDNMTLDYSPDNNGNSSDVTVTIDNQFDNDFENCLVKVKMPLGSNNLATTNSTIQQIVEIDGKKVVYIIFDVLANSQQQIIISSSSSSEENLIELEEVHCYPNPARLGEQSVNIYFSPSQLVDSAKLEIFNLKGQKVYDAVSDDNSFSWDGRDTNKKLAASGIYLFQISNSKTEKYRSKLLLLK